jgi:hypothetical protein
MFTGEKQQCAYFGSDASEIPVTSKNSVICMVFFVENLNIPQEK